MAFSIYEINDADDLSKPSDLLGENTPDYDYFFMTRPDHQSVDDKPRDNNSEIDEIQYDDHSYLVSPSDWSNRDDYLVKKSLALYRLNNDPLTLSFTPVRESSTRIAVTIADTMRATSMYSKKRAPRTNVRLIKADSKKLRWTYLVKGYESWSDPSGHQVILQLKKDPNVLSLNQMDMKVSCSCEFWKYQGPDFNAWKGNYLEGEQKSNGKSPDKTDPLRRNLICKHVYAVGLIIQKVIVKHNLDTQKEVDSVLKTLSQMKDNFLPDITIEGVEDIIKRLDRDSRKKLDPLLTKYKKEPKDNVFNDILEELKKQLDGQEKPFLVKLFHDIKNFFTFKKKEVEKEEKEEIQEQKKEELEELREEIKEKKEEKKQERKEKQDKKKQEIKNRRQKNLKRFIKKQSIDDDRLPTVANVMRMYLEEKGVKDGIL